MRTGMNAAQKSVEKAKERGGGSPGGRLSYLSWKDGDQKIVRFLTDDVITAQVLPFIMCNDGKTRGFVIDDEKGNLVARYADPAPGRGWQKDFKSGQLVEPKSREQTIAVAVLRDQRPKQKGGGFEVVDHREDIEVDGKKYPSRTFAIVQQSSNFWKSMVGYFTIYGTICDRDYYIKRTGGGLDTEYTIAPCDPTDDLKDIEALQSAYGYGTERSPDDPDRFLYCPQTLEQWAQYFTSEDYVKRWIAPADGNGDAPREPQLANGGGGASEFHKDDGYVADEAQAAPPQNSEFASLRERLLSSK